MAKLDATAHDISAGKDPHFQERYLTNYVLFTFFAHAAPERIHRGRPHGVEGKRGQAIRRGGGVLHLLLYPAWRQP